MAWTRVSTGDTIEADDINNIQKAFDGTPGAAQAISLTELEDAANYALSVRNKDGTNSLIARFLNAAGAVVLGVVKEAVNVSKQIVSTVPAGTAPFVVASTTKVDNLHVARATLADTVPEGSISNASIRDAASLSVIGRASNTAGDVADIASNADRQVLRRLGASVGFGALDDTLVGDRVPAFIRRQGGNATHWGAVGTTTYTPTTVRMQAGSQVVVIGNGDSSATLTITYPVAFSNTPVVFHSIAYGSLGMGLVTTYLGTQAVDTVEIKCVRSGTTGDLTLNIHWLAIGPE